MIQEIRKYGTKMLLAVSVMMILSGCSSLSGTVKENNDGSYTAEESADCAVVDQDLDYAVKLKITADSDGTILAAEDNGTQIPDGKDGAYKKAQALFEDLKGKNRDTISDVDTVSGATVSSEAILSAAGQALKDIESRK